MAASRAASSAACSTSAPRQARAAVRRARASGTQARSARQRSALPRRSHGSPPHAFRRAVGLCIVNDDGSRVMVAERLDERGASQGGGGQRRGGRANKRTLRIQQLLAHSLVHLSLFFWSRARAMPRIARQRFARDPPMSHVGLGEALGARASRRAGSRPSVHPSPRRSRPAPDKSAAAARAGRRLSRAPVPFGWAPDEPTSRRERRVARRGRAPLPAGPLRLHSCSEDETSTIWIRRLATEPGPHARAVSSFPPLGSMWPRGRQAVAQLREPKP